MSGRSAWHEAVLHRPRARAARRREEERTTMDIIIDIFGFIFEELPRRVAVSICAACGGLLAIVGFAVRGHYRPTATACHTMAGQAMQAFSSVASGSCDTANLMAKGGLVVGVLGLLFAGAMVLWLFKLLLDPAAPVASE
jgi:hypothetical protein